MGKAALQAQLYELSFRFSKVTAKIAELESALAALSGVSTEITYVLNGYDSIKSSNNLAGIPYEQEAANEETLLTNASTNYETHKTNTISKLKIKIDTLKSEEIGLRFRMNALSYEIANTKEN
ncbi:hypothetical protein [Streptococcus sp. DD04]|uniref:hypothetical protein n=1 Tax=Streptococcus sp. DD04 TaxID=1776578 RepID=UPI000784D426|nr:hypothetical protein [Streptococcus sp. DD04]